MQAELDALLESEKLDDVRSIYYSLFFRIFERFDDLKWFFDLFALLRPCFRLLFLGGLRPQRICRIKALNRYVKKAFLL